MLLKIKFKSFNSLYLILTNSLLAQSQFNMLTKYITKNISKIGAPKGIRGYKKWRGQKVHKESATDGGSLNAIQEGKNSET